MHPGPGEFLHAWIPHDFGRALMGELPESVVVTVWDGASELPVGIDDVRFYVPPFGPGETVAAAMRAMPRLEIVQAMSAGIEHIAPLVPDGVTLCNARGAHSPATSEWVLAAILALLRRLDTFAVDQRASEVAARGLSDSLDGKRVTILGYGSIGEAFERRLGGFDVRVNRVARSARDGVHPLPELDRLLPDTDILVILVPLDDSTRGLVSRERLAALPEHAVVVNAARGGIVDEDALLDELTTKRLRAALDVAEPDPLPIGHPLRTAPGLFYTPHVAGATRRAVPAIYALVGDQLRRMAASEPLANVT